MAPPEKDRLRRHPAKTTVQQALRDPATGRPANTPFAESSDLPWRGRAANRGVDGVLVSRGLANLSGDVIRDYRGVLTNADRCVQRRVEIDRATRSGQEQVSMNVFRQRGAVGEGAPHDPVVSPTSPVAPDAII